MLQEGWQWDPAWLCGVACNMQHAHAHAHAHDAHAQCACLPLSLHIHGFTTTATLRSHRHRQLCRCAYAIPTCPHRTDLGEVTHNTSGITIWHPGRLAGDGEKGRRRGTNNSATATTARARSSGPPSLPPAEALQGGEVCCPGSTAGPWRDQVDTQRRVAQA